VDWLGEEVKPDAILFTNLLIGGCLPLLRERLPDSRLVVMLQGDDIFLDHLPDSRRSEAIELCRKLVPSVDRFVVNSRFYADKMGTLLSIPSEKLITTPLSIDIRPYHDPTSPGEAGDRNDGFRIGYMARIAPEKGLHHLVDSFIQLAGQPQHHDLSLHAAGWLGEANRGYLSDLQQRIADAGLSDRFVYHGSPSLEEKVRLLRSFDVVSVPTEYQDPKGLFVLEALALGVPVIQPEHGAFPELIASTGGGLLVRPGDPGHLGDAINQLKSDPSLRVRLGQTGAQRVAQRHTIEQAAKAIKQICFEDN
jgi:glycosyltransferase involved in cell wall biosynthesis